MGSNLAEILDALTMHCCLNNGDTRQIRVTLPAPVYDQFLRKELAPNHIHCPFINKKSNERGCFYKGIQIFRAHTSTPNPEDPA